MLYVYRNANTGQQVERAERWPRLDALPNWELVSSPSPSAPVEQDEQGEQQGDPPAMPARNASTAAWRAYAVARGMPEAEAAARTRDDLAAHYADGA